MMTSRKLDVTELKHLWALEDLDFKTTQDLDPLEGIIGQDNAVVALDFGLQVRKPGYNIFISGLTGTGRNSTTDAIINKVEYQGTVPDDWCYVYNFETPEVPKALRMPAGRGAEFTQNIEFFLERLKEEIPKALAGEKYEKEKAEIVTKYQRQGAELMSQLNQAAQNAGFALQQTPQGVVNVPVSDGKPMSKEAFAELDEDTRSDYEKKSNELSMQTVATLRKIAALEEKVRKEVSDLDKKLGFAAVEHYVRELEEKYQDSPDILNHLKDMTEDILKNVQKFVQKDQPPANNDLRALAGRIVRQSQDFTMRYGVNLLVSNKGNEGAPVIRENNPTYYNLLGRIEYRGELGVLTTDFTRIKPGALHKANGGYLIVQAKDLLESPHAWNGFKRALKNRCVAIENVGQESGYAVTATLKPQEIPLDVKVILVGNSYIYNLLYAFDEDFKKLFKIVTEFDVEMNKNEENIRKLASFITTHCKQEDLLHFEKEAVARVIEYSSRICSHQEKLSTQFNQIVELLYEADAWATIDKASFVTAKHVEKALREKRSRSNLYERKIMEQMREGSILIETEGSVVGQINGLAVLGTGNYSFGKPLRITVTTFAGKRGIISIERETQASGAIHQKGVMILSGYIGYKFAQNRPLALSANINVEQLYGGIEGDSASSTELYALISSLSEVPIKQNLAVTGSVNQWGDIQPIGGVNEKIEGFYQVCKMKGITGDQGVLIPQQNVNNLMLSDEVVEAVRAGDFHVYAVSTIDDGIEILTGMKAGKMDDQGNYSKDTINYKVCQKLDYFAQISKEWRS